jgi:diaminohydroxyphosphoribosylaminopyrimidine deaminase/5-amino-6-(5-phosphoribosylamino)uracil reductase
VSVAGVAEDRRHLTRALRLAARGRYRVAPNPMVGAVLVRDGRVIGEGWHAQVGGPHAEVVALAAAAAGGGARGATLYVTLEPCAHQGRTPPCVQAVIAAGVRRVVACHGDPDPRVAGRGFKMLRGAGIEVESGLLAEEALALNLRYLGRRAFGRPAVTLKWAMSLDGKIATRGGDSQWISSPAGRRWALALREAHDAIVVGIGTALADDPRLDRRLGKAAGAITRVVLDRQLRLPPTARMLTVEGPVLVYTETGPASSPCGGRDEARRALEAAGAQVVELPDVEPAAVLADLGGRGLAAVLVEGGGTIAGAFVAAGCYDRVAVDCAPLLIGGAEAPGPLGGRGVATLAEAPRLERTRVRRREGDWLLEGLRAGCLQDLSSSLER